MENNKSIIIDRQNLSSKERIDFIKLSSSIRPDLFFRIIHFNIPKNLIFHLNKYRYLLTGKNISNIVINKYFKNVETNFDEDFKSLNISLKNYELINFSFFIDNTVIENEELFYSYLS